MSPNQTSLIKKKSCLSMMRSPYPVDAIEMVWSVSADGRWHSRRSIIERLPPSKSTEVIAAIDFLVKYGFAQSSAGKYEKVRMITDGPSPTEALRLLRIVGAQSNQPSGQL